MSNQAEPSTDRETGTADWLDHKNKRSGGPARRATALGAQPGSMGTAGPGMAYHSIGALARRSVLVRPAEQIHGRARHSEAEGEESGRGVQGLTSAEILRLRSTSRPNVNRKLIVFLN